MIDSRIAAMINFVPPKSRVADIGADHGYLSIELAKTQRATRVIATDLNSAPLDAAKKNIAAAKLEKIIETRLGDGLQVLNVGEVDTICIGGIGGALICKILDDAPQIFKSVENLILQPMNAADKLKDFLTAKNFFIADIDLAESGGIIYEIIFAVKDEKKISARKKIETSPLRREYFLRQVKKIQRVLDEMSESPVAKSSEKFLQLSLKAESLKLKAASDVEMETSALFAAPVVET